MCYSFPLKHKISPHSLSSPWDQRQSQSKVILDHKVRLASSGGAGSFTGMQQEWQFSTQICSAGSFHKGSQMGLCKASWGYEAKPRIHHCFSLAVLSDLVGIPLFLRSPNSLSFPTLPASGLPCSLTLRLGILWSPFVSDQASHSKRESVSIGPRKSTLVLKSVWSCLIKWASFPNTTL